MTRQISFWVLRTIPVLVLLLTPWTHAQLNAAYENGYRPMLDMSGRLQDLVNSAERRADYAAVRDLGNAYMARLKNVITALETAGYPFKDSSNISWIKSTCSPPLAKARQAMKHAETLRNRGDAQQDCRAAAMDLQASLAELSDDMKKCWREHEEYQRKLNDAFNVAREKWWNATREDRRPVEELGRKANEARERFNELQSRANEAGKLYLAAQDQADRARSELYRLDGSKSIDEVNNRYNTWKTSEGLIKGVAARAIEADKAANDADRAYDDALAAWERATEQYTKEAAEGDELYKIVLGYHAKAFEMAMEYKSFSW